MSDEKEIIAPGVWIDEAALDEQFVRASGPGGQNVNKVSSAVQLRYDLMRAEGLPVGVRERLVRLAGNRVTADGVLILSAQRFRTQEANRRDARDRLIELLQKAATPPKMRRATRASASARAKRVDEKKKRSGVKKLRSKNPTFD